VSFGCSLRVIFQKEMSRSSLLTVVLLGLLACSFVLTFAAENAAETKPAAAGAEAGSAGGDNQDQPKLKINAKDFPYKKVPIVGVDFGRGQALALPTPVLVVVLLGFLGFAGYLVYKILNMEKEKGALLLISVLGTVPMLHLFALCIGQTLCTCYSLIQGLNCSVCLACCCRGQEGSEEG